MKKLNVVVLSLLLMTTQAFSQTPQELFSLYKTEVTTAAFTDEAEVQEQIKLALDKNSPLNESQYLVVVDRNPKKQNLYIGFYDAATKSVALSDPAKISTGSIRKFHFLTPLGWFESVPVNGSHRALGTKNENGIRGLGVKGMRVWDFGWQPAQATWIKEPHIIDMRLQMHATDPTILEPRLGRPDSEGCVRLQAKLNNFLDKYGIIDKKYEELDPPSWVLRKDRKPVENAGSFMLVIETPKTEPAKT